METRHEPETVDRERRTALTLGVLAGSAVTFGWALPTQAQPATKGVPKEVAPGITWVDVATVPSTVPGFAKVHLAEVTWQPGAKIGPLTMKDAMVCEMSRGSLDEVKNGQQVKRNTGDVWTCAVGDVDTDTNNGTEPAVMRIFMLMTA